MEIKGKKYKLVEQTEDEIKQHGICGGCVAKDDELLCGKLGICYALTKDIKYILDEN